MKKATLFSEIKKALELQMERFETTPENHEEELNILNVLLNPNKATSSASMK